MLMCVKCVKHAPKNMSYFTITFDFYLNLHIGDIAGPKSAALIIPLIRLLLLCTSLVQNFIIFLKTSGVCKMILCTQNDDN